MATDYKKFVEAVGFLLGQEIAKSPLTPVDTRRMAQSFPGTVKVIETPKGYVIRFTTPDYTEYVHEGTRNMKARPFIIQIINQKGEQIIKQALKIAQT